MPELSATSLAEPVAVPADSNAHEGQVIVLTSVAHALCHMSELVFAGVLLALKDEFRLAADQVTLLGLTGYILLGAGAIPVGMWADRWGAGRVLLVYFFAVAVSAAAVAIAPDVLALGLALTGLGAAISLYHPAGLALISRTCKRRGRALGINGVAGSVGVAGGPVLGALCAYLGHWRLAYVILAVAATVTGLVMLFLRRGQPELEEKRINPETSESGEEPAENWRTLWPLFGAMMLGGLNYRLLVTALPTFLSHGSESGLEIGGSLAFVVLILGGIGQYVGGHGADRLRPIGLYLRLILVTIPMALLMAHAGLSIAFLAAATLAIFMFAEQPVENTILAQVTSARRRSTMYGFKFLLSFGVGALGTQLVGIIWEQTGSLAPVFNVYAGSAAVMALLALTFRKTCSAIRPRMQPPAACDLGTGGK